MNRKRKIETKTKISIFQIYTLRKQFLGFNLVVSTVMSSILFARFPTVDYVTDSCSSLFMTSYVCWRQLHNVLETKIVFLFIFFSLIFTTQQKAFASPLFLFMVGNIVDCRKTSKKNIIHYGLDYYKTTLKIHGNGFSQMKGNLNSPFQRQNHNRTIEGLATRLPS